MPQRDQTFSIWPWDDALMTHCDVTVSYFHQSSLEPQTVPAWKYFFSFYFSPCWRANVQRLQTDLCRTRSQYYLSFSLYTLEPQNMPSLGFCPWSPEVNLKTFQVFSESWSISSNVTSAGSDVQLLSPRLHTNNKIGKICWSNQFTHYFWKP